jgi:SAM-dependent methyltransferase
MTLRIPDDEVARPSSATPSSPPPPSERASEPPPDAPEGILWTPIVATRIITINPPPPPPVVDELAATTEIEPVPDSEGPTISRKSKDEDSWTPFSPTVEPHAEVPADPATVHDMAKYSSRPPKPEPAAEPASAEPVAAAPVTEPTSSNDEESDAPRPAQPSGPDIIIDEDIPPEMAAEATSPETPAPARTNEALDPEEVGLQSEPPPRSEPTDLAEISPEDFVSISAAPLHLGKTPRATPAKPPAAPGAVAPPAGHISKPPPAPPPAPPAIRPPLLLVPGSASPLAPPPMNEAAATRRRARPWWEDLFNDDFIRTMAKITDAQIATEVSFIEESLGLAKGAVVLDMACGTGRHAIEMTRRGYQVVGFDLSLAMLARAADEAQERDQKLNFVQGDMREMTFEETFDGVYAWNTSFGFFEEEKNNAVITNVHRALKAGGLLLLDVANRDFLARQSPSLVWFEGDGCVCMDEMHVDWITSRMRVKRTMMLDDGRTRESDYSIRVYALHELGKILHDHGFRVAEVSGRVGTPGVFFGADSPRILVVAEKR